MTGIDGNAMQAMLDVLRILTAILALGLGAFLFNRDTTRLVLVPIERMMQKVRSGGEQSNLISFSTNAKPLSHHRWKTSSATPYHLLKLYSKKL